MKSFWLPVANRASLCSLKRWLPISAIPHWPLPAPREWFSVRGEEIRLFFEHMPAVSLSSTFTHFSSKTEPAHSRVWEKIRLNVIFCETRSAWWQRLWHKPATHTGRPYAIPKGRLMLQQREVQHFLSPRDTQSTLHAVVSTTQCKFSANAHSTLLSMSLDH